MTILDQGLTCDFSETLYMLGLIPLHVACETSAVEQKTNVQMHLYTNTNHNIITNKRFIKHIGELNNKHRHILLENLKVLLFE